MGAPRPSSTWIHREQIDGRRQMFNLIKPKAQFIENQFCQKPCSYRPARSADQTDASRLSCDARCARVVFFSDFAQSKDNDDSSDDRSAKAVSALPNIYLDLRTNYATVPANTLSIGFSNTSLSSALATLQTISTSPDARKTGRRNARGCSGAPVSTGHKHLYLHPAEAAGRSFAPVS